MAIAVRKDLDMGKGKIAAQAAHAAVECSMNNTDKRDRWMSEGQKKIVVWVRDEKELQELIRKARSMRVNCCPIRDAGLTQLEPDTLTCSGFGPDEDSVIDAITGGFKLV